MPEAKAKVRKRHEEAISAFLSWKEAHPKAKLSRQFQVFDSYVDGAMLNEMLKRKNVKHPV
jgi:hypothetical protein